MRRVVILALLALVLPIAAWADTIDITNQYGPVSLSMGGISVKSEMREFNGVWAPHGEALGYVSFGTGAFTGSALKGNGTFSSVGSWFDIFGWVKSDKSLKHPVMIFTELIFGPIDWTMTSPAGSHQPYVYPDRRHPGHVV